MKLSVVMSCYNERNTIEALVKAVKEAPYPDKQIVIVDDFSTDGARDLLKARVEGDAVAVLYHSRNQGKGAARRTGFKHATEDIVIVQDADLEYDLNEYTRIMKQIVEGKANVVYGCLRISVNH